MASFYRTSAGAEVDLVLELPGGEVWAMEIKRGLTAKPRKGFHNAREDLKPDRSFIVYSGKEQYPAAQDIAVIGLPARSEEHTSELQSLIRISYAVFCLNK